MIIIFMLAVITKCSAKAQSHHNRSYGVQPVHLPGEGEESEFSAVGLERVSFFLWSGSLWLSVSFDTALLCFCPCRLLAV